MSDPRNSMDDPIKAMWDDYAVASGAKGAYGVTAFGPDDDPDLQTELARLVLHGPKRATTGIYAEYLREDETLPKPGDHWIVVGGTGRPLCVIKTTHVEVRRFGGVDATFAWLEGEGDRSLDSWRRAHLEAFGRMGIDVDDDTLMVLEQFDLVWPEPSLPVPSEVPAGKGVGPGFRLANVNGRAVLVRGVDYFDLERVSSGDFSSDPVAAVGRSEDLASFQISGEPDGSLVGTRLGPPIPRPRQVVGIGMNYRSHAETLGGSLPSKPVVFSRFAGCITGPTADVVMHSDMVDFEGELVVVIGKAARQVQAQDAWDYVAGLTVGQDFSDRRVQFDDDMPQLGLAKSFDGFGPIGPVVVSLGSLEDPADLAIETRVNGELRQHDRTSSLIFGVPWIIEYLSAVLTLYPGDLIFTGTPDGVAYPDGPYLQHGDVVTTTIEGIGTLTNRCVSAELI